MLVLVAVAVLCLPCNLHAQQEPPGRLPRVEADRPEFYIFERGVQIGKLTGSGAAVKPDGLVVLDQIEFVLHERTEVPNQIPTELLRASAIRAEWRQGSETLRLVGEFTVTQLLDSSGTSGAVPVSGESATLGWKLDKENSGATVTIQETRNIRFKGLELEAQASQMDLVVVMRQKGDRESRTPELESVALSAKSGIGIELPASFVPWGDEDPSSGRYRIAGQGEATLNATLLDPEPKATLKMTGGTAVTREVGGLPLLSGTLLEILGDVSKTSIGNERTSYRFLPKRAMLHGQASARVMEVLATADDIDAEFLGEKQARITLSRQPSLRAESATREGTTGATLSLSAANSIVFGLSETEWTVDARAGVRVVVGFPDGRELELAGEEVHLEVDIPGNGQVSPEEAEGLITGLRPEHIRSLAAQGSGILPTLTMFVPTTVGATRQRQIALNTQTLRGERQGNAMYFRASGEQTIMNLSLPQSPSGIISSMLSGGVTNQPIGGATVEVHTKSLLQAWVSGAGMGAPGQSSGGDIKIETSGSTQVSEFPDFGHTRSFVDGGPVKTHFVLAKNKLGGEAESVRSMSLESCEMLMHAQPAGGPVELAVGAEVMFATAIDFSHLNGHSVLELHGPVHLALRSREMTSMFTDSIAMTDLSGTGDLDSDLMVLDSPGSVLVDSVGGSLLSRPTRVVIQIDGEVQLNGYKSAVIPTGQGRLALVDWKRTRATPGRQLISWHSGAISSTVRGSNDTLPEGFTTEVTGPVELHFRSSGARLKAEHLRVSRSSDNREATLLGPVEVVATGEAADWIASLLEQGKETAGESSTSEVSKMYPGGTRLTSQEWLRISQSEGAKSKVLRLVGSGGFRAAGRLADGTERDSIEGQTLDARMIPASATAPESELKSLELVGAVVLKYGNVAASGSRLHYVPETKELVLDGADMSVGLTSAVEIDGVSHVRIGQAASDDDDSLPAHLRPVGPKLKAVGQEIKLRVRPAKDDQADRGERQE